MASTPPVAGPGPDMGTAGGGALGEPVGRRRSRLRTYLLVEAGAVALGYAVAVLREGAPATGGGWALVAAGAAAVAVPPWAKSRRELRQETETRSAETLAIETDAKLRLVVGDVVTPIAEVVGRVHQTSGREREALRDSSGSWRWRRRPACATASGPGRSSSSWSGARCGPRPGSGAGTRRPRCSPTTWATGAARRRCCWSGPRLPAGRRRPGRGAAEGGGAAAGGDLPVVHQRGGVLRRAKPGDA